MVTWHKGIKIRKLRERYTYKNKKRKKMRG